MRNRYSNQGNTLSRVLIAGVAVVGLLSLATGTLAVSWVNGWIELPFLKRKKLPSGPPEGTIPVPVTSKAIPAYTRLTREHFLNPKTGAFAVVYLYPNQIGSGMLTNLNDILGRVLAHDKKAGYAVTERELLPRGTRPGMVAGIPPGKRALVLEASRIHGIHSLRLGDHLDLVASLPMDARPPTGRDAYSVLQSLRPPSNPLGTAGKKKANVVVLAEDAIIVSPVTIRHLPSPHGARGKGPAPTGKPVEEVVIAVAPEEVTRISESMAVDAGVTAVAHSGRPEISPSTIRPPAAPPPTTPTVVEVIHGGKRSTVIFAPDGTRLTEVSGSPNVLTPGPAARR